jgi:hypothetical protein
VRDSLDKLPKRLRQLYEILAAKGIDLTALEEATVNKVGYWQSMHRDDDGNAVVTDLARIELAPAWETGPAWPVIAPGPKVKAPPPAKRRASKGWRKAMVLPDMQIGYFINADDDLEPIHDEAAISIVRQVIREQQPDLIVLVGDNADFAEFSRFRVSPAYQRTTQATIDRCTTIAADLRADAPAAEIIWLEGNHEARLTFHIIDNAKAAFGLRQGGPTPDGWPVLSMPHLCRFDDHRITYLSGYPANVWWINDNLRVIHGDKVTSNGSTAHKYLDDSRVSTIFGHVHRAEHAERTRQTRDGPRTITSASAGCLCRIDGTVPSTKGGIDVHGQPVPTAEDWQQGFHVVHYQPGDGAFSLERVQILNGWARFRDQEYRATP